MPHTLSINVSPDQVTVQAKPLLAAWQAQGNTVLSGSPLTGDLIVFEAGPHQELTDDQIHTLSERVRLGASLLLTLDPTPGLTPAKLGRILPTTAWATHTRHQPWAPSGAITAATWDPTLFPHDEPRNLTLPFYFNIAPLSAVERGQGRHEDLPQTTNPFSAGGKSGHAFWTRPLNNRDWKVRIASGNLFASPLLVTGRYGAGKVAVLAASLASVTASPNAQAFWSAVLTWLTPASPVSDTTTTPELHLRQGAREIGLVLTNPQPAQVIPVVRLLTWEGALIGDLPASTPAVTLAPNTPQTVTFDIPPLSPHTYQALDIADRYKIRAGVLSASGSTILAEREATVDLRPPVTLALALENLYATPTLPHTPTLKEPSNLTTRMGSAVSAYAYLPGSTVNAEATIANGLANLAHMAEIHDLTTPENPSLPALNDGAIPGHKTPIDGFLAYGTWNGAQDRDNALSFTFPHPVTLVSVTLVGTTGNEAQHNPGALTLEIDGKEIVHNHGLDQPFAQQYGRATVAFKPTPATTVTLRLPWLATLGDRRRVQPWLAEIELNGWVGDPGQAVSGTLHITREDAFTGQRTAVLDHPITLPYGATQTIPIRLQLPATPDPGFHRLTAEFQSVTAATPILAITPRNPILSLAEGLPPDAPQVGYIVTRGFRNVFPLGTGTAEVHEGWGQPDDLIWAYSRNLKQLSRATRTQANRLYVTDTDMRHYSTPWRSFNNGEYFYDLGAPKIVENMQKLPNWHKTDVAILGHSDRWDTGPDVGALHSWQDFVDFDQHLREIGKPGLAGKTRQEITADLHDNHEDDWQAWQLKRYVHGVTTLRENFAAAGKRLIISAQGLPMVATEDATMLAQTIQGMSDDSTWGMLQSSIPLTTARQLAEVAYNPVWRMSTLLQWGYNSNDLNNYQWHVPVGTTEPSRRHYLSRAFRAMVWNDGRYGSVYTFGFNSNAGTAFTMNDNDWQQMWLMHERHTLLTPQAPIGAGLVLSSSTFADPAHTRFSCGDAFEFEPVKLFARTFQLLHEAGISIPFAANASSIAKWKGHAPLILLDLNAFSDAELHDLEHLQSQGVPMAAFADPATLSPAARSLFNHPAATLLGRSAEGMSPDEARTIAARIAEVLPIPLSFSPGIAGYGFTIGETHILIAEDWLEQPRTATLRLASASTASHATACLVNDHTPLKVTRDNAAWVIEVPMRPGDGALVALRETA